MSTETQHVSLSPSQRQWRRWAPRLGGAPRTTCRARLEAAIPGHAIRDALARIVNRHDMLRTAFAPAPVPETDMESLRFDGVGMLWDEHDLRAVEGGTAAAFEVLSRLSDAAPAADGFPIVGRAICARVAETTWGLSLSWPVMNADRETLRLVLRELMRELFGPDAVAGEGAVMSDQEGHATSDSRHTRPNDVGDRVFDPRCVFDTASGAPSDVAIETLLIPVPGLAADGEPPDEALLLACWHVLLSTLTDVSDPIIVVTRCGRRGPGQARTIGPMAMDLPLAVASRREAPFDAFVRDMRQTLDEMDRAQDSFDWCVGECACAERSAELVSFAFDCHREPASLNTSAAALDIEHEESPSIPATLRLSCIARERGLELTLRYAPAIVDASAAAVLADRFSVLLTAALRDAASPVAHLIEMSEAHRRNARDEWNATAVMYDGPVALHALVERHAAEKPDAVAVRAGERAVTYAALDAWASTLARQLRAAGVGAETRVGVCLPRSVELVVALLGILKAGGAYVPLEPELPAARLHWQATDADVALVITADSAAAVSWPMATRRVPAAPAAGTRGVPGVRVFPAQAAYVLYTSGSSGQPKGVVVSHAMVANYLRWAAAAYGLSPAEPASASGAPVHSPVSFDLTVTSLWGPLTTGHAVVLTPDAIGVEGLRSTWTTPGARTFTLVKLTPAHMEALLIGSPPPEGWTARLIVGGEALRAETVAAWHRTHPDVRIINEYGPTETVVGCCVYEVPAGTTERSIAIGRPIANTQIHVLDAEGRTVPIGETGEIFVGGAGVARGYWRRPALTAARFVPDPFSREPGRRMYRTGDGARYRPSGDLEYLGRRDDQVKVRGYRVEPGEVAAALAAHAAVRDVVVTAVHGANGDVSLAAYLVARDDQATPPDARALRGFLESRLPPYMVPATYVWLDALPLTPNGKVDRRALPAPAPLAPTPDTGAPVDATEARIAAIWADVLGVPSVGVHDDFFEIGGHSLFAMQVMARVMDECQIDLPLHVLFDRPTVAGVAAEVRAAGEARGHAAVAITPRPSDLEELPLSFAQQRLWFLSQLNPVSSFYNVHAGARLRGPLDYAALERALTEIVARHDALRTVFPVRDGRPSQVVRPAAAVSLPIVDLTSEDAAARADAVASIVRDEADAAFDTSSGPLIRLRLLRLGEEEHVLLCALHHLIADGWSVALLIREVAALYTAFSQRLPSPLAPLPIQYPDYTVWQRTQLSAETLSTQMAYWKTQLADVPTLTLPTDRPRPVLQSFRGALTPFALPADVYAALRVLNEQTNTTLFMTLLAGLSVLLSRYSRQRDITVGSPIAGRTRPETESLIGLFVNTLVFRTDLSGNPTVRDLLARVRAACLGAYANADLPFEQIVDEVQAARDLGRNPLFQVMLVLQNATPTQATVLPEVTVEPLTFEHPTAKFDLNLMLTEEVDRVSGALEYATDLFDASTIARMLVHLTQTLTWMSRHLDTPLSELSLLTDHEREQMIRQWNDTAREVEDDVSIVDLVDRQAAVAPGAPAVRCGDAELTYGALPARINSRTSCAPSTRVPRRAARAAGSLASCAIARRT